MTSAGPSDEVVAEAAVDLTVELVRLDTVNPGLVPGAAGERAAVELLADRLSRRGFRCDVVLPTETSGAGGGGGADRPSLVASAGPDGSGRSLLLNGHLDTVGVAGMTEPFAAHIVGDRRTGRLLGRGSCDMKAGVAAMVVAAESVAASSPEAQIVLALVADEEHASLGTDAVIEWLARHERLPDAALVGEPTGLDLVAAHRGFAVVEVELRGRVAHSSQPQLGVNAVTHLGRLLAAVEEYDAELAARPPHPVAGHGSLLATVAAGGSAPFSLAGAATATVERRTLPGEAAADALAEVQAILDRLRIADATVDATATLVLAREAWELDGSAATAELADRLAAGVTAAGARAPQRVGAPYWMESALWQAAGVPTVVCGPAGGGLHADDEWVDLAQVRAFAVGLRHAAAEFGRSGGRSSPPGPDMIAR